MSTIRKKKKDEMAENLLRKGELFFDLQKQKREFKKVIWIINTERSHSEMM